MIAAPVAPDGPGAWYGLLPGAAVAAGRDHGSGLAGGDGGVAGPRVVGAIGGDGADRLLGRDLLEQFGEHGPVTDTASGHLDRPYLQRLGVDAQVDLGPLAWPRGAVLAAGPVPFAHGLNAGAVDQQVQRPRARAVGNSDGQIPLASAEGAEVGHGPVQLRKL